MRLTKWIESLYEPQKTNFKDAAMEDLILALNEPGVRQHWLNALVEELRAINVGVDRAMRENKLDELPSKADRRRAIVFCLNQILDSKTALDNDLYEEQHKNQAESAFNGVAVQRV